MAIVLNPITLPASKVLNTVTSLIGELRFKDTIGVSDIVNELVNSCRVGKVDFGKGIVFTFKTGLQPKKALSTNSSALTITKPNVAQETIEIDTYNFIPLSVSEILTRDAVLNGELVNTFLDFTMSLMSDTETFDLFDICNSLYQDWVPGQASQTIQVNQLNTTGLTGQELQSALTWNANEMARVMRKTINNMKIKNNKFTDVATYIDANDGTEQNVVSALRSDDLKLVMNDKYWTNFISNTLASLYHSEKIGEMIPGEKFVLIPEDAMKEGNEKVIGWLSDKSKFALADFYKTTESIRDPSTLYTNYFHHYAIGYGVFKYAPGVKFVENTIEQ